MVTLRACTKGEFLFVDEQGFSTKFRGVITHFGLRQIQNSSRPPMIDIVIEMIDAFEPRPPQDWSISTTANFYLDSFNG